MIITSELVMFLLYPGLLAMDVQIVEIGCGVITPQPISTMPAAIMGQRRSLPNCA
jgi:hypothetical protein